MFDLKQKHDVPLGCGTRFDLTSIWGFFCSGPFEACERLATCTRHISGESRSGVSKQASASRAGGRILEYHSHPSNGRLSETSPAVLELCHSKPG